ncbi:uroporphyrinogen-III C-methyltransferase [Paenibacillus sp. y28]|uniref:uroporphyrinogen-III C-methyltransferase n=1 Tax=Paenibacillus sp. y28 TaxID=3129110 RepID=UPI0030180474
MPKGKVYLVGAGPGDPKLITVRGLEAIQKADVVVYDRLASPRLLRHLKAGAEKIYVGKLPDRHTLRQEVINQMLVDLALQGKTVTRLKGGDPSIFGRVGEEAELLADHDIRFEIIPGITSAIAVPTYAGIPVTHRDFTSSLAIVTGHECPQKQDSSINWEKLSTATGTLVFLMGVSNLQLICNVLMEQGRDPETPVAIIRWGTTMEQKTVVGTLQTIVELAQHAGMHSPAIIIVGEVVRLRDKLSWFETRPLFGKRVLVTRARSQASELVERIDDLGGESIEFPVIETRVPQDEAKLRSLDEALHSLSRFDWVMFTSVNGVDYFFRRLRELNVDIRTMHKAKVAAVGPKTAESLLDRGIVAEVLPAKFQAEDLLDAVKPQLQPGQQVLLPRADIARKMLPIELRELGLHVTEIDAYETVVVQDYAAEAVELLQSGQIDIVTFTSSSTVTNLLQVLEAAGVEAPVQLLAGIRTVCIGPVTAQTARDAGLQVHQVAAEATIDSMIQALVSE